jgi:tRNA threonylcarbamoyl adenosine modification protein (Sua5/YciO/YrdC/YwlC family)
LPEVEAAARAALAGDLVVIPTDTVYGIGTRPDLPEATEKLFAAKRRPRELELPVLVPSPHAAGEIGELGERGARLAARFWPGPLTIVVKRAATSASWDLGGDPATIGLRMPAHPLALDVLRRTGPLAVTSANLSGGATPDACAGVREVFGDLVAAYVCSPQPLRGLPSTVLDVTGPEPRVLRSGAVTEADLLAVFR